MVGMLILVLIATTSKLNGNKIYKNPINSIYIIKL